MKIHPLIRQIHSSVYKDELEIYLIRGERNALIDTGTIFSPAGEIVPALEGMGMSSKDIELILNTHGHPDHIGGNGYFKEDHDAEICIHREDGGFLENHGLSFDRHFKPALELIMNMESVDEERNRFLEMSGKEMKADRLLEDNAIISLGKGCDIRVIHLPGHTPGSVGYYWEREGILFSGDSMPGLHNQSGCLPFIYDPEAYGRSIDRIRGLSLRLLLNAHPYRGVSLPPSSISYDEDVQKFIEESYLAYEWFMRAGEVVAPSFHKKNLMKIMDDFVSILPGEAGFRPVEQLPSPMFNAITVLSFLELFEP